MSHPVNDLLFERAADMVDYWQGTEKAQLILDALDSNDLDKVQYIVNKLEGEAAIREFHDRDAL